jgi:hypothetical protein
MTTPATEFVLVRGPGAPNVEWVSIVKVNDFDFTDYSFLKMTQAGGLIEEWVPTAELSYYQDQQ